MKRSLIPALAWILAPAGLLATQPAAGMLRVLKYRPLTEVQDKQICVYASHEKNRNPENRFHAQNTKAPLVCRLMIMAEALPAQGSITQEKTLTQSVVQKFEFGTLTKACVSFAKVLPAGFTIRDFAGMNTECTTAEAAARVFPEYKG